MKMKKSSQAVQDCVVLNKPVERLVHRFLQKPEVFTVYQILSLNTVQAVHKHLLIFFETSPKPSRFPDHAWL